jgi:hypothetical protein
MTRTVWAKIVFLTLLVLFLGLACNLGDVGADDQPNEEEPAFILEAPDDLDDEPAPYLSTAPPRDESKIILMEVEPSGDGDLAKVKMLLPEQLVNTEIFANDTPVEALPEGNAITINLAGKVTAKVVTFSFRSSDEVLATCMIMMDGLLTPEGDCNW